MDVLDILSPGINVTRLVPNHLEAEKMLQHVLMEQIIDYNMQEIQNSEEKNNVNRNLNETHFPRHIP